MVVGSVVLDKHAGRGALKLLKRPARLQRRLVSERRVWPDGIVVISPERQLPSGIVQSVKYLLIQQLVAQAAVEAFDEGMSRCGLPGSMSCQATSFFSAHFRMARLVNSVPLSLTMQAGLP